MKVINVPTTAIDYTAANDHTTTKPRADSMEKDWKLFRKRVPEWRERFLKAKNQELIELLSDPESTPTDQFWDAERRIRDLATVLTNCLDGHSRSRMTFFLQCMLGERIIDQSDLEEFSESFRADFHPNRG